MEFFHKLRIFLSLKQKNPKREHEMILKGDQKYSEKSET